jgi:hypothetical protein
MLPSPILPDAETTTWLLRDTDGDIRAALVCWSMVLSAFVILRIPREVLLGCVIAAGATVGLATAVIDMAPEQAIASPRTPEITSEIAVARGGSKFPMRSPAAESPKDSPERKRPY